MSRNNPEGENATKPKTETAVPDRVRSWTQATQAERRIKDSLEDDEVREALKLNHEGKDV